MKGLISVIIVNWNKKNLLNNCLRSLLCQTYKDFEIMVVDNGSTDGSAELVKKDYPDVKLICLAENKGFSIGNNLAIKNSISEYIALLNNDMEVHHQWLGRLYKAIKDNPEIGFCASKILDYSNRNIIDAAGIVFCPYGIAENRGYMQKENGRFNHNGEVFGACAGAALYNRKMLNDIGLFDEEFSPAYLEDVDLSFRAQLKGYKCLYVADAIAYHHGRSTLGGFSPHQVYLDSRNGAYVLMKNMPLKLLLRYSPVIGLYNILSFAWHIPSGTLIPYMLGKASALKNLKRIHQQRKAVQRAKIVSDEYIDSVFTHYNIITFIIERYKKRFLK